ncbi:MAG: hypothetical protein C4581_09955 [Nitrospiraceae bacterium]|nr:MAG: hypothetical protein C4581_09955 [Nitrospiraceae bacterium]
MKKKTGKYVLVIILALMTSASMAGQLQAAYTLNFALDMEYSGGTAPSGTTPWITATFIDIGTNQVQLSMTANNLTGNENIKEWYFNFDDSLDLGALSISAVNTSAVDSVVITKDMNNLKADGDGKYDFMFAFSTSGNQFTSGETVVYNLSTGSGDASSFNFLSSPAGGHGPFYSAAHIQNTGDGTQSGWIANETSTLVPEPISSTLFIVGAATLGFRRLRNIRKG